jgi:hypothetical protein
MSKKDKIHVVSRAVIMDKDHILVCKTCDLPVPKLEAHIELMWLPLITIGNIDFRAEPLKHLIPKWLNTNLNDALISDMYAF